MSTVVFGAPVVDAADDVSPPTLVDLSVSRTLVDVTHEAMTIEVTARVTDDVAGVQLVLVKVGSASCSVLICPTAALTLQSGDGLDGTYVGTLTVPFDYAPGVSDVSMFLLDNANNSVTFEGSDLSMLGFTSSVTVVNTNSDVSPPSLLELSVTPTTVDVSQGPATVSISARVTDPGDLSRGVGSVLSALGSAPNLIAVLTRQSGDEFDGIYTGEVTIPQYFEPADLDVRFLLNDWRGNSVLLEGPDVSALGLPSTVAVLSGYASSTFPPGGGSISTGQETSVGDPINTNLSTDIAGAATIAETASSVGVVAGYVVADRQINISAPAATASEPLRLEFRLDASLLAQIDASTESIVVFRNGVPVPHCSTPAQEVASPDPCVHSRTTLPDGDALIGVYTSQASAWNVGRRVPSAFSITTSSLPQGALGRFYSVTLNAVNGATPYKWKRVGKLPPGLKLGAKTGTISGTPKKRIGTFGFTVQASYKTKVKGERAVKHVATRQLSITVT